MTFGKIFALTAITMMTLVFPAQGADINGKWTAEFDTQIGIQKYTYQFKVEAGKLTGTATGPQGAAEIQEGKADGDSVSFVEMLNFQGQSIRIDYKGTLAGDEIKFTRKVGEFATEDLVAKRVK